MTYAQCGGELLPCPTPACIAGTVTGSGPLSAEGSSVSTSRTSYNRKKNNEVMLHYSCETLANTLEGHNNTKIIQFKASAVDGTTSPWSRASQTLSFATNDSSEFHEFSYDASGFFCFLFHQFVEKSGLMKCFTEKLGFPAVIWIQAHVDTCLCREVWESSAAIPSDTISLTKCCVTGLYPNLYINKWVSQILRASILHDLQINLNAWWIVILISRMLDISCIQEAKLTFSHRRVSCWSRSWTYQGLLLLTGFSSKR